MIKQAVPREQDKDDCHKNKKKDNGHMEAEGCHKIGNGGDSSPEVVKTKKKRDRPRFISSSSSEEASPEPPRKKKKHHDSGHKSREPTPGSSGSARFRKKKVCNIYLAKRLFNFSSQNRSRECLLLGSPVNPHLMRVTVVTKKWNLPLDLQNVQDSVRKRYTIILLSG